jgi:V/A-type H+-transporting ATPase subunit I
MIAQMEKLFMVAPKRWASDILLDLQQAGVVQIDRLRSDRLGEFRLDAEQKARLHGWDSVATSSDHTLRLLGLERDAAVPLFSDDLAVAESLVSLYEDRASALVEERESLKEEKVWIDRYGPVVTLSAELVQGLDESPWLTALTFLLDGEEALASLNQELSTALDGRFELAARQVGDNLAVVIIVLKRDADAARGVLGHHGVAELPRAPGYTGIGIGAMALRFQERTAQVPQELAAVEDRLQGLVAEAGGVLKGLWNRARDESARLRTLTEAASGRYGFALFGWVPSILKDRVVEAMRQYDGRAFYTFETAEAPSEAARVPVMLENPGWAKPFEALISFLNTPRYDSWDPTSLIAFLFPLWFGMIVGDVGYGLVFAILAAYLSTFVRKCKCLTIDFFKLRLSPEALAQTVRIMVPMIGWTMLWGVLYGEFFGDLLLEIGIFADSPEAGYIPILIRRTETATTANPLILLSIGFGAIQVLHGFYLKARLSRRQRQRRHFWEGSGYFGGVIALILFAYAFMAKDYRPWVIGPMIGGIVLFLTGMVLAKTPLMLAELPTQGGHILSYIRIYAVGLASAILAGLSTDIGFALYRLMGDVGIILGILVGLVMGILIHGLLLVLLTVSHVLQPIRLIWVEFFTKFDFYTLSGRPYRPFRSIWKPQRQGELNVLQANACRTEMV